MTKFRLVFYPALSCFIFFILSSPKSTPELRRTFSGDSMGVTAAMMLHQSEGFALIDARKLRADDLPIPDSISLKNARNLASSRRAIVIGDENEIAAARKNLNCEIAGWVPSQTLNRTTKLQAQWEISPRELMKNRARFQVVDLREDEEFGSSRIPRSEKISMFDVAKKLDKRAPVALFCLTGHRSAFVVEQLRAQGFSNLRSVRGGWLDWKNQGLPLEGD